MQLSLPLARDVRLLVVMSGSPRSLPDELTPPRVRHRFALSRFQLPGLIALALLPVLALVGVFGESHANAMARSGELTLSVRHPHRLRFEQITTMDIDVTNTGRTVIDTLVVSIDPAYLGSFSGVAITPSASAVFEVELPDVQPGTTRRVHVEMDAMRPGRHRGAVSATGGGADTARLELSTIVFP